MKTLGWVPKYVPKGVKTLTRLTTVEQVYKVAFSSTLLIIPTNEVALKVNVIKPKRDEKFF